MKGLSVLLVTVLSLSMAEHGTSDEVVLTARPPGEHFYFGEPIILTCKIKSNASEVWKYTWFRHNLTEAFTTVRAHRVSRHTYSISALTSEDSGPYWCKAQKRDTNFTLLSDPWSLSVIAASPPAFLEVWPDSSQHLQGKQFSLHCSGHGGITADWTLKQLQGFIVKSSCFQIGGNFNMTRPGECSFNNITSRLNGLYWCEAARGDQRSNTINITVSDGHVILQTPVRPVTEGQKVTLLCNASLNLNHTFIYKDGIKVGNNINVTMKNMTKAQEGFYKCGNPSANMESPESWLSMTGTAIDLSMEENTFKAAWVWPVCVIIIVLLLIPVTFLLVPSLRNRVKLFPTCREFNAHQEMPRTKPDATEIQWDLAWMEMTNLLDKPCPGS